MIYHAPTFANTQRLPKTPNIFDKPNVAWLVTSVLLVCLVSLTACDADPTERGSAGVALARRGDYVSAVQAQQVAQALAPDAPIAYYNAGEALALADDLPAAALALEQALKSADDALLFAAYHNLGCVYYLDGRYFEAVDAFKQAMLLNPTDASTRYNYELALLNAIPPTPPNQEQQNEPEEGETDPQTTPTPQPNAQSGPTPTPPRQDNPP
ncbi:MAG: tetratricopeptide repeat protein, partial [Armatimonadetes bacterium]|nr:tetratricopeptide repeat protein [Anaerolineae bacterium]